MTIQSEIQALKCADCARSDSAVSDLDGNMNFAVDGPAVMLEEEEDGRLSLARAFAPARPLLPAEEPQQPAGGRPLAVRISRLAIRNGAVWWVDARGETRLEASALDGFDTRCDAVWMAEVAEESTHVVSSLQRSALFLSAMRHFAEALRKADLPLHYTALDAECNRGSLDAQLRADIAALRPQRLVVTAPGEWRVLQALRGVAEASGLPLDVREDRHFFGSIREFAAHAKGRKTLRLEYFYREQRVRHSVLMDGKEPLGGEWNFDADNRASFGPEGPGRVPPRSRFAPDAITREVITLVRERFASHPGRLDDFAWPVTREQALQALHEFVEQRLPHALDARQRSAAL